MSSRKKTPAHGLPAGWMREESIRQSGISRGKCDVYYLSPAGRKVRSKPDLIRALGPGYDLSCFDYRTGKMQPEKTKISRRQRTQESKQGRIDLDTSIPNRQTASIFKQPVTKFTGHRTNKVKVEQTRPGGKAPQQLFREKRLNGMNAVDFAHTVVETINLPRAIQAVGPTTTTEELLRRIASQLHQTSSPITGQTSSNLMKDPCIWLNTQQPICRSFIVTEDDIRKQEYRVLAARERLEQALKQDSDIQRREIMLLV